MLRRRYRSPWLATGGFRSGFHQRGRRLRSCRLPSRCPDALTGLLSNVNEGGLISMHAWLRPSVTRRGFIVGTGLLMGMLLFPGGIGRTLAHAADGHPAKIHEGTCDALGRVAFPLTGVGAAVDLQQQPIATPTAVNPHSSYQI